MLRVSCIEDDIRHQRPNKNFYSAYINYTGTNVCYQPLITNYLVLERQTYPFWSYKNSWLLPLSFIIGLSAPCFILIWACSKEVNPPDNEGIPMGVVNMVGYSGAAIMQYLVGFILQQFKGEVINGVTVYPDYV